MKPKYLRISSDLHLEAFMGSTYAATADKFIPADERDSESVLMLAGDICSKPGYAEGFIKHIENRFLHVFYVPGNHEYYRHDFNEWNQSAVFWFNSLKNTTFATDDVIFREFDGWRLAMGTLWADGGKDAIDNLNVHQYLNDFRVIYDGDNKFTVERMKEINARQKKAIDEWIDQPFVGKTVVMTHHLPSYRLCHPRFGSAANGGFASNCENILARDNHPDIWIHGHTHDTIDEMLWGTRIVCNPAGYRGEWETPFNTYSPKFVELNG